jgi:hypothetical protein
MIDSHTIHRLVDGHSEAAVKAAEQARLAAQAATANAANGPAANPHGVATRRLAVRLRTLALTGVRRLEAAVEQIAG